MKHRLPALLVKHHGVLKAGLKVAPNLMSAKRRGKRLFSNRDALLRFVLGRQLMLDRIKSRKCIQQ